MSMDYLECVKTELVLLSECVKNIQNLAVNVCWCLLPNETIVAQWTFFKKHGGKMYIFKRTQMTVWDNQTLGAFKCTIFSDKENLELA